MKPNLTFLKFYLIIFIALISVQTMAQIPNVTTGYLGNTFINTFPEDDKWVQNFAEELDVASDGTMITASEYDENGRNVGIFKDGQPVAYIQQFNGAGGHTCWGYGTATKATAVDDNYLYVNNCEGLTLRFNRSSGYSYVDAINTGLAEGMTYSGGFVYMITPAGLIQKRSTSNLATVSLSFTVTGGYDLAVDNAGNIWVLTTNKEVIKYTSAGVNTGTKIAAQSGWNPSAVNYDAFNNLLLVPDNGPRRQVIKFNTSGAQVGTFGDLGGISAGTKGIVGDLRFWDIAGCGTDANGNIYVALSEDCVSLRKFNSAGVKQWEVLGTMFTDVTSIDPASDGNDIYSVNEHMKFDYSTQKWSLISKTVDCIAYPFPNDPRSGGTGTGITSALMRRVNGNLIMFTAGMYDGDAWDVYRFDGEIAVHTNAIKGLGWSSLPDKNGNIWYASAGRIKKIPLTGFSGGNPVFGAAVDVTTTLPSPIISVERLEYDVNTDVMYVAGWTKRNPNRDNNWGLVGSTIASYPNWSTGNRTVSNTVVLTKDVGGLYPKAMSVAGGYVFVGGSRDRGKLYVYNTSNLSYVGFIAAISPDFGWLDIPHAVQAFKKSNGQYVILVEDNATGKNIVYQWCPSGTCSSVAVTGVSVSPTTDSVSVNGSTTLTATVAPSNATNKNVTWSSSNTAIATVSPTGVVTGVAAGSATITVTTVDGSKTATSAITVTVPTGGAWTIADNQAPGWTWVGYTIDLTCTSCYNGSSHHSNAINQTATYTFTGTNVEAYCETWSGAGSVQIYIDGVLKGTYAQNVAPFGGAQKFATITGLTNASHTIRFTSTSASETSIDYIRFAVNPPAGTIMSVPNLETAAVTDQSIRIYPNPANSFVNIDFGQNVGSGQARVEVLDMQGRKVYASGLISVESTLQLNTSEYSKGVYLIRISRGTESVTKKLMIQ